MKTPIRLGLVGGGLILLYTYAIFLAYGDFSSITLEQIGTIEKLGYLRYVLMLLSVFYGIKTFHQEAKTVSYGSALLSGVKVAVVVAVIVGFMEFAYVQWWNPDFTEQYGKLMLEGMEKSGATPAKIAEAKQQMEAFAWMRNPLAMGAFYFVETVVIGTIGALILALLYRTKKEKG